MSPPKLVATILRFVVVEEALRLSELENAVLGVIWRCGPCSAYVVQKNFDLVSAAWSASPGSVYPLTRRLRELGFLCARETTRKMRKVTLYAVTKEGERQLAAWVIALPDWAGRPAVDVIRTRAFYLEVLTGAVERTRFLDAAETATRLALDHLEQGIGSPEGKRMPSESLAQMGGILQLRARLEWLGLVRAHYIRLPLASKPRPTSKRVLSD